MTVFDTRALAHPLFTDADFTATKWDGAAEKAAFANALCRFISADFRESLFTQKLYRRLALSFGHIAHFERRCLYNHFFRDLHGKVAFLEETLAWVPCGQPSHTFCDVECAVLKRRIPFSAVKFDDDLARAYGVVWEDDLFVPAGDDGRYTTNVEGFFGAQQEWLANNLPERGSLLAQDEYGRPVLPKKAEQVYGKPGKSDQVGHYLDPYSGTVKTVVYRVPADTKTSKAGKEPGAAESETAQPKSRPDVTQKGNAIIGDLRTDALHQALRERDIDDGTLLALCVLALGGKNVSIQSAAEGGRSSRAVLAGGLIEGGVLTTDQDAVRKAARAMLQVALSCRDNMTNSGIFARVAGDAIDAKLFLPNMATEEFLACLSKAAIENAAAAEGVKIGSRGKDTRANLIERYKDGIYVYPSALFPPTPEEIAEAGRHARNWVEGSGADDASIADGEGAGGSHDERPEDGPDTGPWTEPDEGQLPAAAE